MIRFTPGQLCAPTCCDDDCEAMEAVFDEGLVAWPSQLFVMAFECQYGVGVIPTIENDTCEDCVEFDWRNGFYWRPVHPDRLYAVGDPIQYWRSQAQSTCTGGWVWELQPPATPDGEWTLYAGGSTSPAATYTSSIPPHRYWVQSAFIGRCNDDGSVTYFTCNEFELQSYTDDCSGWPEKVTIFGCFCDGDFEVCHICHDCAWDRTPQTQAPSDTASECCEARVIIESITNYAGDFYPDPWMSPDCGDICALTDGDDDYIRYKGNTFYEEDDVWYPACLWRETCNSYFGTPNLGIEARIRTDLYLIYDKHTDRYKLVLTIYWYSLAPGGIQPPNIMGVWVKDWFQREAPCWNFGTHELIGESTTMECFPYYDDSVATITFDNWIPCGEWYPPDTMFGSASAGDSFSATVS